MKIPADAIIADDKLTGYLLVPRPRDDKSRFLAQAGFSQQNPQVLRGAIRRLVDSSEAVEDGVNDYGLFLRVEGDFVGPLASLSVVLIWMRRHVDGSTHFVTLKPRKEKEA